MENKANPDFSERLRQVQYHFKLTNEALGEIVGVSGSAIGDIINGKTANPRINVVTILHTRLGIDLNWLLTGQGDMIKQTLVIKANPEMQQELEKCRMELQNREKLLEEKEQRLQEKERTISVLQMLIKSMGFSEVDVKLGKLLDKFNATGKGFYPLSDLSC